MNGKKLSEYQLGNTLFYKSHEGLKESGCGKVIDIWKTKTGKWLATVKGGGKCSCVGSEDLY